MVGALELLAPDGRLLAAVDPQTCRRFITVDPAGTSADRAKEVRGRERSFTVCQIWDQPRGELSRFLILRHQVRGHLGFGEIKSTLEELHAQWRPERIWIENEKLGIATVDQLAPRLPIAAIPTRGRDKAIRASRLLNKLERGEVFLPAYENSWRHALEAELLSWTGDEREPADQIDAAAYAAIIADTAAPGILRIEPVVFR
jgi:phage terminase large subunit-like protein